MGFRTVTDFFNAIAAEQLDINEVIEQYVAVDRPTETTPDKISAEEFQLQPTAPDDTRGSSDVLVIGEGIKVSTTVCRNAATPFTATRCSDSYPPKASSKSIATTAPTQPTYARATLTGSYRPAGQAKWASSSEPHCVSSETTTSVSSPRLPPLSTKESSTTLRSISIDSNDGIFQGFLGVGVRDTAALNTLIKKLKTVKGVKDVQRSK